MRPRSTRDIILDELINGNGAEISSEKLCARLGMTRAAVWKHMELLRQEGWDIKALPRRGYRLEHLPDLLHPACVRPFRRTADFAPEGVYFPSAQSTNAEAEALAETESEDMAVFADMQTLARDRYGEAIECSDGKGIYMSLLLHPGCPPYRLRLLSMTAALAAVYALEEETSLHPQIDWPADIICGGKLLGGINCRMKTGDERTDYVIIGFWLNAAQENMHGSSASVKMLDSDAPPRALIAASIMDEFGYLYENLFLQGKDSELAAQITSRSGFIGKTVRLDGGITGRAAEITPEGALGIKTPGGTVFVRGGRIEYV